MRQSGSFELVIKDSVEVEELIRKNFKDHNALDWNENLEYKNGRYRVIEETDIDLEEYEDLLSDIAKELVEKFNRKFKGFSTYISSSGYEACNIAIYDEKMLTLKELSGEDIDPEWIEANVYEDDLLQYAECEEDDLDAYYDEFFYVLKDGKLEEKSFVH